MLKERLWKCDRSIFVAYDTIYIAAFNTVSMKLLISKANKAALSSKLSKDLSKEYLAPQEDPYLNHSTYHTLLVGNLGLDYIYVSYSVSVFIIILRNPFNRHLHK